MVGKYESLKTEPVWFLIYYVMGVLFYLAVIDIIVLASGKRNKIFFKINAIIQIILCIITLAAGITIILAILNYVILRKLRDKKEAPKAGFYLVDERGQIVTQKLIGDESDDQLWADDDKGWEMYDR